MEIDKELDTNVPREDSFFKEVFDAIATSRTIPDEYFSETIKKTGTSNNAINDSKKHAAADAAAKPMPKKPTATTEVRQKKDGQANYHKLDVLPSKFDPTRMKNTKQSTSKNGKTVNVPNDKESSEPKANLISKHEGSPNKTIQEQKKKGRKLSRKSFKKAFNNYIASGKKKNENPQQDKSDPNSIDDTLHANPTTSLEETSSQSQTEAKKSN